MSEQENVASVEKLFAALNARELGSTDAMYAADFQAESPGRPEPMTLEQSRENLQGFLTAFPDLSFELGAKVAQGDFVAVTWVANGTHTGPLPTPSGDSIPATNKKVTNTGSSFYHFENGKIIRVKTFWDMASLLMQIGMMPGM